MPMTDYFLQGPVPAARDALAAALVANGFEVTPEPSGSWTVTRGSTTATVLLGAFAGRSKQRLVFAVRFFDHQGTPVARFERESGAGAMGGAIGVSRSNSIFTEVSQDVTRRLTEAGVLAHVVAGA